MYSSAFCSVELQVYNLKSPNLSLDGVYQSYVTIDSDVSHCMIHESLLKSKKHKDPVVEGDVKFVVKVNIMSSDLIGGYLTLDLNQPIKWAVFRLDALLADTMLIKLYTTGPQYITNKYIYEIRKIIFYCIELLTDIDIVI
jgi:hypothetical protein